MPEINTQEYRYFISYAHPTGLGRTEVSLRRPMRSLSDVEVVERLLRSRSGVQITVTGWQRFED